MERKRSWVSIVVMTLLSVLWLIPTIGLLVTSFRDIDLINSSGWWNGIFGPFTVENYAGVFEKTDMGTSFINSFAVALPATIIPITLAAFAAYAFTFLEFKGRDFLFVTIVAVMVVPIQVALQPMLDLLGPRGINIAGQYVSVWLLHAGFGMPLAIYTLRNYMTTLPRSIIESAKVDGATHFQTFWRLVFPMSMPAIAGFAILQFLWVWNDLLIALMFLKPQNSTVIVSLSGIMGTQGQGWELLTAGAFISMLVPMIIFFSMQRFFVRGMTAGAVKG
ncbi:MAG: carbohydrate ABC transporter permease [Acidobacteriota bacterium]|nr:carbohydrate ABC transporter permease [Acidobacteriota bacterium]NLH71002.1 carbohydrate ABC transporter permease [Brooklawnia sp.]